MKAPEPGYYNRRGERITASEATILLGDDRIVERTRLELDDDVVTVSTVHLVFDHQLERGGPPLIFETMLFGIAGQEPRWRCSTEEEARLGHGSVVEMLRSSGVTGLLASRGPDYPEPA